MIQEQHFDDVAEVYDESLPPHVTEHYLAKRTSFVLATCPPPARLLDVGCGTGALAARLAARGYEATGLDPSDGMLSVLRERAPDVTAVKASATEMPFDDGAFDLSVSVATMHHIAEPGAVRRALSEMVRVVRPGGTVIVWDHNPRNPYWPYLMKRVPQDRGDERLVGVDELVSGLRAGGAGSVSVRQLGMVPDFVPERLLRRAAAVERAAERTPGLRRLLAHNVVVAERR
jgi:ubiquinone/menaquinone biosynthesis C-methylase UbiE